ncbi:MAG: EAL domain-containing protein [Zoogloeaceae bacterium]|jgi:diguanylate cyclase (GGDEF)-like protein/PAS domain S-box-containing protein|nr:EAL domain-containing protein [Zoogloeaceae bacterium]
MIRLWGRSFRIRLLLASFLVSSLVLSVLIGNSVHLAGGYLKAQHELHVKDIGNSYASAIAPFMLNRDYAGLRDVLEGWVAENTVYLVVSDEGQRIVSVGWSETDPLPEPGMLPHVLNVIVPIQIDNQIYGELRMGQSTAFIDEAQHTLILQSGLIAAVGVIFLIFLLSLIIYYLTRGLTLLAEASIKVGQGDFHQRVDTEGNDEISALANSFNKMIDAVQSRVRALEESEQRFRAIADYTYGWENWFDPNGNLKWVNPAVQRIVGYSPEECMAMPDYPLSLVHPEDIDMIRRMMQQAQDGHSGQDLEFRAQCRNGRIIWVAISWQPIHDEQGNSLGYRSSIRDITLQHHANEELVYQAAHDPLTGLNNRRFFERQLQQELEASHQDHKPLIILYLDIDQFKVVNDTCGHVAGDQLLIGLAKTLQESRDMGFLARLGGDEFGILMRDCDETEAIRRANLLINKIRAYSFAYGGRSFRLGASVGVVRAAPGLDNFTSLLMAADTACYAAKERGRNRVELYTENDEYFRMRNEEFRSVGHVTTALTEGRFLLYFQRVEPLRPDLPRHAEILIRLRDFLGNIQSPARFIAAAERFNLMTYIDRWVVENVCQQLAEWDKAGIRPDVQRFAINVSGASLSDREFPDFVQRQITEHGIDPTRLCFEITESCAVGQLAQALEFIERMHSLDASLSLDDFGTGLSSFAYLKQFKVDYMKIDGMFVKNLNHDTSDQAVVKSMVQLARAYNLKTVAEFVCNDAVYKIVQSLGVDYAQGYARHVPEPLVNLGNSKWNAPQIE